MCNRIIIRRADVILAEQMAQHPSSSYGALVWCVHDMSPAPGLAVWARGDVSRGIDIIGVRQGWLIIRQPDGLLAAIVWTDGSYHADLLVDENDMPVKEYREGLHVRGAIRLAGDTGLGAVL